MGHFYNIRPNCCKSSTSSTSTANVNFIIFYLSPTERTIRKKRRKLLPALPKLNLMKSCTCNEYFSAFLFFSKISTVIRQMLRLISNI
jgi:hypothetical protein